MADLDNGQRSPKFGKGLLQDGGSLSKLADNPIFQRLTKNRWFQKLPPWAWGSLALGGLFAVVWIINSRVAPSPTSPATAVGGDTTALAVDILVKLSLIVGLIYGALWVFRRWRGGDLRSGAKKIDILETVHLSPRRAIHLVRAGNRVVLIGATDQNVTFLSDVEALESSPAEQPGPAFAEVLAKENGAENLNGTALVEKGAAKNRNSTAEIEKSTAKNENGAAKNEYSSAVNAQDGIRDVICSDTAGSSNGR